jgi:putative NADH-flavin reductase
MKTVTVFGANGRVGSLVVDELVKRGYTVRAFVHGAPHRKHKEVAYIKGDVANGAEVEAALGSADAVISALGSWGTPSKDILTVGMKHIIPAMQQKGVRRVISLTGADAWASSQYTVRKQAGLFTKMNKRPAWLQVASHAVFSRLAPKIIQDGETHIALLEKSSLDWTVVRSPVMNEKGASGFVLTERYPWPWQTINRQAVAVALVDQLESTTFIGAAPYITRR